MATTSPDNISYPTNADAQKTLEQRIQDTATSVQTALNTKASLAGATFTGVVSSSDRIVATTPVDNGSTGGIAVKAPPSGSQTSAYIQFVNNAYSTQYASIQATPSSELKLNATYVTKPYQSSFLASTASGYKVAGSWTEIGNFPNSSGTATAATQHNIGSNYNASNGYFTAPVAGRYTFGFGGWASYNGAGNRYAVGYYINGVQQYICGANTSAVDSPIVGSSIVLNLAANDNVRLFMYSSVTMNLGTSSHNCYWFGYFLG